MPVRHVGLIQLLAGAMAVLCGGAVSRAADAASVCGPAFVRAFMSGASVADPGQGSGHAVGQASGTGSPLIDFFTGAGNYMPRTHCMVDAAGRTDWPWVGTILVLTAGVIV